jgi:hypothetical protein
MATIITIFLYSPASDFVLPGNAAEVTSARNRKSLLLTLQSAHDIHKPLIHILHLRIG